MKLRLMVIVMAFALAATLSIGRAGALQSRLKGDLPALEDVFAKLFSATVRAFSMEQMQKDFSLLSEEERAAVANFLGKDRWDKLVTGLDEQKKKFLEDEYARQAGKADASAFLKALPKVFAININIMTTEQVKQTMSTLSDKEMATLTISMGNDGLKTLFTVTNKDKHAIILSSTPDWVLLEMGIRRYDSIKDYTCILLKQEKVGGKMQGVETIELKYRVKPFGIYAKWIDGPFKDREALYNSVTAAKSLRVREGGALGVMPVTVPVDSAIAKRGTNHLITEIGLGYLLGMIRKDYQPASQAGDITRKDVGIQQIDGVNVYVMESSLRKNPSNAYYCHRIKHYIDYLNSIEIKAEMYDWNDQIMESFTYTKLRLNVGLKDSDFDQNNPAYKLK